MNKLAAIYARVSSDRQREDKTIASQTRTLREYAQVIGYTVPSEWVFEDEGYSGARLARAGLNRLRDLVTEGHAIAHTRAAVCAGAPGTRIRQQAAGRIAETIEQLESARR